MFANQISIKNSSEKYSKSIWIWRNDSFTREMSKNKGFISWEDHKIWFKNALKNKKIFIFMGFYKIKPVGVIFFNLIEGKTNEYLVSINISPEERGKGIGKLILKKSISKLKNDFPLTNTIYAHVKKENYASNMLFKKTGFNLKNSTCKDYHIYFLKFNDYHSKE